MYEPDFPCVSRSPHPLNRTCFSVSHSMPHCPNQVFFEWCIFAYSCYLSQAEQADLFLLGAGNSKHQQPLLGLTTLRVGGAGHWWRPRRGADPASAKLQTATKAAESYHSCQLQQAGEQQRGPTRRAESLWHSNRRAVNSEGVISLLFLSFTQLNQLFTSHCFVTISNSIIFYYSMPNTISVFWNDSEYCSPLVGIIKSYIFLKICEVALAHI